MCTTPRVEYIENHWHTMQPGTVIAELFEIIHGLEQRIEKLEQINIVMLRQRLEREESAR